MKSISLEDIKQKKCFVCFDKEKRPISPETGKFVNIKDNSWTYKEAEKGVKEYNNIVGVGIILGEYEFGSLCGLDIDNCINETGKINPIAQDIINQLNTYTEYSPSKKGVHCLFLAVKENKICKNNSLVWCKCLEMYDKDRYFTLTENLIADKPIENRQDECNTICNKYLRKVSKNASKNDYIDKHISNISNNSDDEKLLLRGIQQKGRLKRLWNGERQSNDESSNDLAFLNSLRFFSNGNRVLMKEYFLKSPYFLMKDEYHKKKCTERSDYLDRTIERSFS